MDSGYQESVMPGRLKKLTVAASGFIALDIVFGREEPENPHLYAGGTAGNVLAGLAYLGWQSIPFARLRPDSAGEYVRADLSRWGVDTSFIAIEPIAATPIVIEKIFAGQNGIPKHRFLWNCPDCNGYLPPYRALLASSLPQIIDKISVPAVFYTDRVSRSTLSLAKYFKDGGALVFFEPSGVGDQKHFREMLKLCDVLKYSNQRAKTFSDLLLRHHASIEIETLSEEGARFRLPCTSQSWTKVSAYEVDVKDTAGAGDWTTVGIISNLCGEGGASLHRVTKKRMTDALEYGQALAALNCQFEGPRGAMYRLTPEKFSLAVKEIRSKQATFCMTDEGSSLVRHSGIREVCPTCTIERKRGEGTSEPAAQHHRTKKHEKWLQSQSFQRRVHSKP
jgi:sugar/nucleoside kinase (ribokinase family)